MWPPRWGCWRSPHCQACGTPQPPFCPSPFSPQNWNPPTLEPKKKGFTGTGSWQLSDPKSNISYVCASPLSPLMLKVRIWLSLMWTGWGDTELATTTFPCVLIDTFLEFLSVSHVFIASNQILESSLSGYVQHCKGKEKPSSLPLAKLICLINHCGFQCIHSPETTFYSNIWFCSHH